MADILVAAAWQHKAAHQALLKQSRASVVTEAEYRQDTLRREYRRVSRTALKMRGQLPRGNQKGPV
jgi:hypothetical protein